MHVVGLEPITSPSIPFLWGWKCHLSYNFFLVHGSGTFHCLTLVSFLFTEICIIWHVVGMHKRLGSNVHIVGDMLEFQI